MCLIFGMASLLSRRFGSISAACPGRVRQRGPICQDNHRGHSGKWSRKFYRNVRVVTGIAAFPIAVAREAGQRLQPLARTIAFRSVGTPIAVTARVGTADGIPPSGAE